jgi:hypothetical protein
MAAAAGATVLHIDACDGTFCELCCAVGKGVRARSVMPLANLAWMNRRVARTRGRRRAA